MSFSLALFMSVHCACTGQFSEAPAQATSAKVSSAIAGSSLPLPSLQVPQMSHLEAGRYLFGMMSQQKGSRKAMVTKKLFQSAKPLSDVFLSPRSLARRALIRWEILESNREKI